MINCLEIVHSAMVFYASAHFLLQRQFENVRIRVQSLFSLIKCGSTGTVVALYF